MARQVIVLEKLDVAVAGNDVGFRLAFWCTVPVGRQPFYANAAFVSAVKDGSVTAPELTALQNGSVVEIVEEKRWPAGKTGPQMKADAAARFTALQAEVNARNPWASYGTSFDGAVWADKAIA